MQVDGLLSSDTGTGEGDDLVGLVVDDVFKLKHHFAREHGIQTGALAFVDLVGGRRVGRVWDTQRAVVDGALGVFGADMVDSLEVLLVAEVNLIGLNADNRAWVVRISWLGQRGVFNAPYFLCRRSISR